MTSLKQLQDSFQKALLKGDLEILSQIPDSPREKHDVLLGVYQYAYGARLMEFLENDYPQLHSYLGDQQFKELCKAYIDKTPSHTPNARWYGSKLPVYMAGNLPYKNLAQLHELALLELGLNTVFDEADEQLLTLQRMAQIAPDQWPSVVFSPVAATRRMNLLSNATAIWNAVLSENTPPDAVISKEPLYVLVYRDDFQSSFRSMVYAEAMMWDKMAAGVPFGVLCELMAAYGGEDDAAMQVGSLLHTWISSGLIVDNFTSDDCASK